MSTLKRPRNDEDDVEGLDVNYVLEPMIDSDDDDDDDDNDDSDNDDMKTTTSSKKQKQVEETWTSLLRGCRTGEQQRDWFWKLYTSMLPELNATTTTNDDQGKQKQSLNIKYWKHHQLKHLKTQVMAGLPQQQQQRRRPNGLPLVVIVTQSADRCRKLCGALKGVFNKTQVVTLFSKHTKVELQRKWLNRDVRIVIGTPKRLHDLVNLGYLKLRDGDGEWTRKLVIDLDEDAKQSSLLSQHSVNKKWFFEFFHQQQVVGTGGGIEVSFF